jgi:dephospho-CoA kinase
MLIHGLTGGIATGKSTVAKILSDEHQVPVVDADQAGRAILQPGQSAYSAVVKAFGREILMPDGQINRRHLRTMIMESAEKRHLLETITHPAIQLHLGAQLSELARAGAAHAFVEAALMVETGSYRMYTGLIVVTCRQGIQMARLMARDGHSHQEAQQLLAAQLPLSEKEAVATVLINNNDDMAELYAATDRAWASYKNLIVQ